MTEPVKVTVTGSLPATFPAGAFGDRVEIRIARTADELRGLLPDTEVLYSGSIPDGIPAGAPRLRWIQLPSAGVDHQRLEAAWKAGITVTSSRGIHVVPMSEHLFAMLLALVRQLPAFLRAQQNRQWIHDARASHIRLGELRGRTMGIVGWGKIGAGVAHLAGAFGMRVVGTRWSVVVPREEERQVEAYDNPPWLEPLNLPPDIVYPAAQLGEVLAQSDVVVCILPLTAETFHTFNGDAFAAMKRGALFLNIGRGAVVDETALIQALGSGHLAGAGLDVFEEEPLSPTNPLWQMQHVIISPHVGGVSERTRERAAELFAVNLSRFLEGQSLLNCVEPARGY
jgi:phosphoglycerate dehydrogenase-like enzyme